MRHKIKGKKLNMNSSHRMSVLRNLSISLFKANRIETTLAKARALKSFVEPIITKAKNDNINSRRLIVSKLGKSAVTVLPSIFELALKFQNRPGGYTRLIKTGNRYGDCAEIGVIEFVE